MYEISVQEYLTKLKEYKSYIKRCKRVLENSAFWPSDRLHDIMQYSKLGINVIGPLTLLQATNFSLPNNDILVGRKISLYRAMSPVDRAIIGCHIVIAIDKRNGKIKVCHTYEDEDMKNPIKPLNEAIKDLEEGIKCHKFLRSSKVKISGAYDEGPLRYPIYRIVTYSNDTMTYPNVVMGKYGLNESIYDKPMLDVDDILQVLESLKRFVGHLKEES